MIDEADTRVSAFVARLAARLKDTPGASLSRHHRATFLAVCPLVEGALASGYTMKATWEALRAEGSISMTYETFRSHCRRRGLGRDGRKRARDREPAPAPDVVVRPQAASADRSLGFQHERVPQRNEIY